METFLKNLCSRNSHQIFREFPLLAVLVLRLFNQSRFHNDIEKSIIMTFLLKGDVVSVADLKKLFVECTAEISKRISQLQKIGILLMSKQDFSKNLHLNPDFTNALKKFKNINVSNAFLSSKQSVVNKLENLYKIIMGDEIDQNEPSQYLLKFATECNLMNDSPANKAKTLNFLFSSLTSQLKQLFVDFISLKSQKTGHEKEEILNFLFVFSEFSRNNINQSPLTNWQTEILAELSFLGLIDRVKDSHYIPNNATFSLFQPNYCEKSPKSLIVETNFKIYAYTPNALTIFLISKFSNIERKLKCFVSSVITRNTVLSAIREGVSADGIISFLKENAIVFGNKQSVPSNVIRQIFLWDQQMKRFSIRRATLLTGFVTREEFRKKRKELEKGESNLVVDPNQKFIFVKNKSI